MVLSCVLRGVCAGSLDPRGAFAITLRVWRPRRVAWARVGSA